MDKMNTVIVIFCTASMAIFSGTYYVSGIVNSSCTFDNGTCGWLVTGWDQYNWTHHHGNTSYVSTGPYTDHTTASENGYYFYTKSTILSKQNPVSDLQSGLINPSPKQCLTFWYHMYGNHINTLKVFQKNNNSSFELWNKSSNQGNTWHSQSLSLYDIGPYQIMFRATRGNGIQSEIAVDDIFINNTECKKVDNTSKTSNASDTINTSDKFSDKSGSGDTSDASATRDTNDTSDTSDVIDTSYTIDTSHINPVDTSYTSDTIDKSDTSVTSDTIDTIDTSAANTVDTIDTSDAIFTSDTGMVVGLTVGGILLACVVVVIVVFIRRHTSKSRPREKIRNNLSENDYIGTQDIALPCLPLTANDSSYIQNDGKNTNTADAVRRNIDLSDNSTLSDHKYSIVDQTPETTLNETTKDGKGTTDSYMVLDPSVTGFNRTILPNTYEFAKPVMDAENNIGDEDQYALSEEGVYDHSGNNRHKELEINIYNHAVDTIYDSGSHKRNDEERDDTYDHFFGQKTEDDYDISTTT